jgi:hypothetical protein
MPMNEILAGIDAEIARLERVRALLNGTPISGSHETTSAKRRKLSAEVRAKIAAAQKARWARVRKAAK